MSVHLIDNFRGGISQDMERGVAGAFSYGENLDIRKREDTLSCQQVMKKESSTTVTDLIRCVVVCSSGDTYAFGNQGKIYKRTSAGVWSLLHTDTDGDITGAVEWRDNIYWCTATKLKYTPIASINFASPTVVSTGLTTGYPHYMKRVAGSVYIANGEDLGIIAYDRSFSADIMSVTPDCHIKCIGEDGDLILLLCTRNDKEQESFLFTFDPNSTGWSKKLRIGTRTGNTIASGEFPIIQAGDSVYYTNYAQVQSLHWIEGKEAKAYGSTSYKSYALMGLYPIDESTATGTEGLYSYGRRMQGLSQVLVNEFKLSPTTTKSIGCVWTYENLVLASWWDGDVYGVDVLDPTVKATAVYESLVWKPPVTLTETINPKFIKLKMKALPASCRIAVQYRTTKGGSWKNAITGAGETIFNTSGVYTGATEVIFNTGMDKIEAWQTRVVLYPTGNTTPEILAIQTHI